VTNPRYMLVLAALAGCQLQLRLEGAACPCAVGWSCCPGANVCARDLSFCPTGGPQPDGAVADGPVVDGPVADAPGPDGSTVCPPVTDGPEPDGPGHRGELTIAPVAPTPGHAMYQGAHTRFRTPAGAICTGRVSASMSWGGFCYLAASDEVMCAGLIGGTDHGMSFTATGQTAATQIMVTFSSDGVCVAKTDHSVWCMGSNTNAFGESGTSPTFTRWTEHCDVAAIATGTWDQLCGITLGGQVFCGGLSYSNPPVDVGPPGQTSVWVEPSGTAQLSDSTVLRAAESYTSCQVRAHGLQCDGEMFGPTDGTVVMGARAGGRRLYETCWLTERASVTCTYGPRFAAGKVLYLALDYNTDSLCAIYNDGSVWCIGSNPHGKLGTGSDAALEVETMVAPPGSARVGCDN
jgi:hypothetical protein